MLFNPKHHQFHDVCASQDVSLCCQVHKQALQKPKCSLSTALVCSDKGQRILLIVIFTSLLMPSYLDLLFVRLVLNIWVWVKTVLDWIDAVKVKQFLSVVERYPWIFGCWRSPDGLKCFLEITLNDSDHTDTFLVWITLVVLFKICQKPKLIKNYYIIAKTAS